MKEKIVSFFGHRYDWQNIDIYPKLKDTIIHLIKKGYRIFYNGYKGYFDKMAYEILIELKKIYPHIKIYIILTSYNNQNNSNLININYENSILPPIEHFFPKIRIIKRNEWIVDNSDVIVCHIFETYKSGAYNAIKYAKEKNKEIIYL